MPATDDYDAAALLASPVRRVLVETLEAGGRGGRGMTAAELAPHVGLHVSTVRFHLDRLVAGGVLRADFHRHEGAGRPRKLYSLGARAPGRAVTDRPLGLLAALLAEAMAVSTAGAAVTPEEAGRRWAREHVPEPADPRPAETQGAWLARVGEVVNVLEAWGYQPELSTSEGGRTARVELSDCPFLDLARSNTAVVCGVHRGLIAESMRRLGEPGAEVTLEPFVTQTRCLALIRATASFRPATPALPEERR